METMLSLRFRSTHRRHRRQYELASPTGRQMQIFDQWVTEGTWIRFDCIEAWMCRGIAPADSSAPIEPIRTEAMDHSRKNWCTKAERGWIYPSPFRGKP
jgi:hypothetical protein